LTRIGADSAHRGAHVVGGLDKTNCGLHRSNPA
jgi:hypothetical protein